MDVEKENVHMSSISGGGGGRKKPLITRSAGEAAAHLYTSFAPADTHVQARTLANLHTLADTLLGERGPRVASRHSKTSRGDRSDPPSQNCVSDTYSGQQLACQLIIYPIIYKTEEETK